MQFESLRSFVESRNFPIGPRITLHSLSISISFQALLGATDAPF
ncbi:MAG: hypothetical protein FD123_4411, partial [Bacteroidetes bacterium]